MNKYFRIPFAVSGDRAAVPDSSAGTDVNDTVGYGSAYQADLVSDPTARYIERDKFNQLMFEMTQALQELQAFGGASDFITSAQNGGSPFSYAAGACVRSGGLVYESLVGSNTTTPPGANWAQVSALDMLNPPGIIVASALLPTSMPGWLYCNGQSVSRTAYARLFAKLGTLYGVGDGSTTFTLPDYRGVFLRAYDDGRGVDAGRTFIGGQNAQLPSHSHTASTDAQGIHQHTGGTSLGGNHVHSASTDVQGVHSHQFPGSVSGVNTNAGAAASHNGFNGSPAGVTLAAGGHGHNIAVAAAPDHNHTVTTDPAGYHTHNITVNATGTGTEVRVVNVAVTYYIKT